MKCAEYREPKVASSTGRRALPRWSGFLAFCGAFILLLAPFELSGEAPPAANGAFSAYLDGVEKHLAEQHGAQSGFLSLGALNPEKLAAMRRGELMVEKLTPSPGPELPGAMLHHWRGSAFVAGAKAADFERLLRDYNAYPRRFSPQVLQARVLSGQGDRLVVTMRVRQRHIITVVMDTTYDVTYGRLDGQRGYSLSRSKRIAEIESPGTAKERTLSPSEEHGFLWQLNTYWSWEERDGGLFMQVESVSLTRSIPHGLGWLIGPFVESVPRESLEFTLRSASDALRRGSK